MGEVMIKFLKGAAVFLFVILSAATLDINISKAQETAAEYTPHILYCGERRDAIQLVEYLMVERNESAREMMTPQKSSCHYTTSEHRPPMYTRNHEVIYTRYALGHTFTVESSVTASGRIIYVMGAYLGE